MPDAALLFAAGLGKRMAPLTDDRPKPLVKVAGRPLIDHALDLLRAGGVSRVMANSHYLAPLLSRHLAQLGIEESYEPELLDTGGGLRRAAELLGVEAMYSLNTDAVWTGANPVLPLRAAWDPLRMDALLLLVPLAEATAHKGAGDFSLAPEGRLIAGRDYVYTGLQMVRTAPFLAVTEPIFSMHRVWRPMQAAGRMYGLVHRGGWCDVGRPDSLPAAEAMLHACYG